MATHEVNKLTIVKNGETYVIGSLNSDMTLISLTALALPAHGATLTYNMEGLTVDHVLFQWNFSVSSENTPPVDLNWATYDGYFTIENASNYNTNETFKPVFILPAAKVPELEEEEEGE